MSNIKLHVLCVSYFKTVLIEPTRKRLDERNGRHNWGKVKLLPLPIQIHYHTVSEAKEHI
ncbi:hypothetical protein KAU13_09340 [candidate division WOR-3 bacterium]|nr:hypothetical protein [candidate division WOR-3 bacterium]